MNKISSIPKNLIHDIDNYIAKASNINISDITFISKKTFNEDKCKDVIDKINYIKKLGILKDEKIDNKLKFFNDIRLSDIETSRIEGIANNELRSLTGSDPINVGSFGLLLNLKTSDLDLGVSFHDISQLKDICIKLSENGYKYKQARDTRYLDDETTTKRFVFSKYISGTEIDVSVYHDVDLKLLSEGNFRCRNGMSYTDKAEHTWNKYKLMNEGFHHEYNLYKLDPYITYKPGFKWISID